MKKYSKFKFQGKKVDKISPQLIDYNTIRSNINKDRLIKYVKKNKKITYDDVTKK